VPLKVKIDNPDFPKDHVFGIEGLGLFENGKERTVSEEQEQAFVDSRRTITVDDEGKETIHELSVKEALKNDPNITVEGTTEAKKGGETK
jgi:hypothetical protein